MLHYIWNKSICYKYSLKEAKGMIKRNQLNWISKNLKQHFPKWILKWNFFLLRPGSCLIFACGIYNIIYKLRSSQWYDIKFLKIHDRLHLSKALTCPHLIGWKSVKKIQRVLSGSGEKVAIGSNPLGTIHDQTNSLTPTVCHSCLHWLRFQGFPFINVLLISTLSIATQGTSI